VWAPVHLKYFESEKEIDVCEVCHDG
jgi:hypothetical protein